MTYQHLLNLHTSKYHIYKQQYWSILLNSQTCKIPCTFSFTSSGHSVNEECKRETTKVSSSCRKSHFHLAKATVVVCCSWSLYIFFFLKTSKKNVVVLSCAMLTSLHIKKPMWTHPILHLLSELWNCATATVILMTGTWEVDWYWQFSLS